VLSDQADGRVQTATGAAPENQMKIKLSRYELDMVRYALKYFAQDLVAGQRDAVSILMRKRYLKNRVTAIAIYDRINRAVEAEGTK
jgi:hypothetical protein